MVLQSAPRDVSCRFNFDFLFRFFFFFNDTATTEIYTLSLHDALPIRVPVCRRRGACERRPLPIARGRSEEHTSELQSHVNLVCRLLLEKKKKQNKLCVRHKSKQRDNHQPLRLPWIPNACSSDGCLSWAGLNVGFFFNVTATTEIYTLSLHDALPSWPG